MKRLSVVFILLIGQMISKAQEVASDSANILEEVVVYGFGQRKPLLQVPAAVSSVGQPQFNRYNNSSIGNALNAEPGIKMEERSPGSYRLSIRGSSLRSPFGVRNVKVYYNNIPFTDPGGNTYLNLLGFYNVGNMEIWKGPGSSMYGAGTGGVLLIRGREEQQENLRADISAGSFGLLNYQFAGAVGDSSFRNQVSFQQLRSDGYRDHTAMDRKVLTWDMKARTGKGTIRTHLLYGDLFYQTPGALTLAEYESNPKGARPAGGIFPSSQDAHAALYYKTVLAGASYEYSLSSRWTLTGSMYGAFSKVKNPAVRNYEIRNEPHTGGRVMATYQAQKGKTMLTWSIGAEAQQGFATVRVAGNVNGQPDTLQSEDEADLLQYFGFTQARLEFPGNWTLDMGISMNKHSMDIRRLNDIPVRNQHRTYRNEIAPRIALLKRLGYDNSIYATVSRGFSPPTTSEVLPSTGVISTSLEAESGMNYELGWKSSFMRNRFNLQASLYYFDLNNTIAQRRDAGGADYFVNAGSTSQKGAELQTWFRILNQSPGVIRNLSAWMSYSYSDYTYSDYVKDDKDLSGRNLPGVAPHTINAGLDLEIKRALYANLTWNYSDKIPLNDANSSYASSYSVFHSRISHKMHFRKSIQADIYFSVDNIFNVRYSLGNDINAFGGRFYNAAAGRNFTGGISLKWIKPAERN